MTIGMKCTNCIGTVATDALVKAHKMETFPPI